MSVSDTDPYQISNTPSIKSIGVIEVFSYKQKSCGCFCYLSKDKNNILNNECSSR